MNDTAEEQPEEIRRIILNKHLDILQCGPKRPGSAPPQAEMLPGSPMGLAPMVYNIITGEPLRGVGVSGGQHSNPEPPAAQRKNGENDEMGLIADAEEALRSRPEYVSYYYANMRNNPRLPPPLTSRNFSAPWVDPAKVTTTDLLMKSQKKPTEGNDSQTQATISMYFGSQLTLKEGAEPIPIRSNHYFGQDLRPQGSSSLSAVTSISPPQHPNTLAAAWANIASSAASGSAAQHLDSLLGNFGSPKSVPALCPLLTANLKAQASGISLYSVRSADEQALHDSLYVGSTPHTPMGSQHGGTGQLFGSFNQDSPRGPSMDLVGRSMSSNSLGGSGMLGKDPKVNPAAGPTGRLASVIGDQRATLRTPSKLRIGSNTLLDTDSQQQLLTSLSSADTGANAAAAAAAAEQLASAAQVQAAVEAFHNLPPAAVSAFAAALGGGSDQANVPVAGHSFSPSDVLLGGGGGSQQQQMQAMYMAAAMYPMYYAQQAQQAGMQSIQAMQAAAIAGFPPIPAGTGGYHVVPCGVSPGMLSQGFTSASISGLPPGAAASLFAASAGGVNAATPGLPDVAALSAAGLRPQQQFATMAAGSGLVQPYPSGMNGSCDYGAYYQKMLEAHAAAAASVSGRVPTESECVAASALLRGAGPPPPPPPPGQPPPLSKDSKRNSGGEPHPGTGGLGSSSSPSYVHSPSPGGGGDSERRLRTQNSGRDLISRNNSGNLIINIAANSSGGAVQNSSSGPQSPSQAYQGSAGGSQPHSRLRPGSASQYDNHLQAMGSQNNVGSSGSPYARETLRAEGPQRRNSQRRGDMSVAVEAADGVHSGGVGSGSGGSRAPRNSGDTLLDEFKTNKTGRKYELREILGHVYEFSLDQHGSRFIQQKLEGVSAEDMDAAFSEVHPRILNLMTDVFGNYVVQKFLEHGNSEHRGRLAKALHGHVLQLSLQMYGCRVVQKALEVFTEEQQVELVAELDGHIMRCVRDQNGNHVIQKCIECVATHHVVGLLDNFLMCVVPLSTHPFGCRIIQRILEHVRDQRRRAAVMVDILGAAVQLTQDQYGNYVIQHVLERGTPEERSSIAGSLAATVVQLSMHKFASNVIEKCLTYGSTADRDLLINRMLGAQALQMQQAAVAGGMDGDMEVEDPVQAMMKDQFGNYVVQKVLEVCKDDQREAMLARVRQQLHALKRFTYGKHIVARVEKLLSAGTRYQTHAKGRLLPDDEALAAAAAAVGARLGTLTDPLQILAASIEDAAGKTVAGAAVTTATFGDQASDGGSQPPAPTTPPVSAGAGEGGYTGSIVVPATSSLSSDVGVMAIENSCSGVTGVDKDESPVTTALLA